MRGRTSHGFTRVELVVVAALLAILGAVLLPAFAQERDQDRRALCLSNLQQITMAMLMYVNDWDGTFPYAPTTEATSQGLADLLPPLDRATEGPKGPDRPFKNQWDGGPWVSLLRPYTNGDLEIWYCPNAPRAPEDFVKGPDGQTSTNYNINAMLVLPEWYRNLEPGQKGPIPSYDPTVPLSGPVTLALLKDPANLFLWEDWGQAYPGGLATKHQGGTNLSTCDGHAKWMPPGSKGIKGGWWVPPSTRSGLYW